LDTKSRDTVRGLLPQLVGSWTGLEVTKQLLDLASRLWSSEAYFFVEEALLLQKKYDMYLTTEEFEVLKQLIEALKADLCQRQKEASDEYRSLAKRLGTQPLTPEEMEAKMTEVSV
jgi:hypothetical protein